MSWDYCLEQMDADGAMIQEMLRESESDVQRGVRFHEELF
jgi:hypothetical protein